MEIPIRYRVIYSIRQDIFTRDLFEFRPSGDYNNLVHLTFYEPNFSLVGGINAPKKTRCRGEDGRWRTELVKGKDDLRQDAVMQQVFSLVNRLLARGAAASDGGRGRRLRVRQYNVSSPYSRFQIEQFVKLFFQQVVPLSQRSGVLEWCENTTPLGEYLLLAHRRHRPQDISPQRARKEQEEIQKARGATADDKLRRYVELCSKIRPVMRYFFHDRMFAAGADSSEAARTAGSGGAYFERQQAYTRR